MQMARGGGGPEMASDEPLDGEAVARVGPTEGNTELGEGF